MENKNADMKKQDRKRRWKASKERIEKIPVVSAVKNIVSHIKK